MIILHLEIAKVAIR